jgi:hypothetical protein
VRASIIPIIILRIATNLHKFEIEYLKLMDNRAKEIVFGAGNLRSDS